MMPYAQYAECADQHAKNQAHFGARAATVSLLVGHTFITIIA
jgi:hypothetical protein